MIKVYALLPKREDISKDRFHEHWSTIHLEHAKRIDRLRRYTQSHLTGDELAGIELAPYDGLPEVWYDDNDSAVGQGEDPNYTEYAQKDEPNFVDMDRIAWVHTDDFVVEPGPELEAGEDEGRKAILMLKRDPALSPEEFADRFDAAARAALDGTGASRTAFAIALPEMYEDGDPTYDGVLELRWAGAEELERGWAEHGPAVLEAIEETVDLDRSHGCVSRELRVIWP